MSQRPLDPIGQGLAWLRAGRAADAEGLFRAVLERLPGQRDARNGLALALASRGAWTEALEHLDQAIGDGAVPPSWHANRASLLTHLGRPSEAAAALAAAVARDPGNLAFRQALGEAALAAGDAAGAAVAFRAVLALDPGRVAAWSNLGTALDALGRFDEAAAAYREATRHGPAVPEAWVNLGNLLNRAGDRASALAAFAHALTLRPGFAPAEIGRGVALLRSGHLAEAITAFDAVLAARPDDPQALNNRAIALQEDGRIEEAIAGFRAALAADPTDPVAHNNLGGALQRAGRHDEAITILERALALRPDYPEACGNLASALDSAGRPDDAVALYRRALSLRPGYAKARANIASLLHTRGRQEEAEAEMEQGLILAPRHLPTRLHAAFTRLRIVYRDMAERDRSRAAYRRDLEALAAMPLPDDPAELAELVEAVGASQPFYLAYQGGNDRDLQALYGGFVCRVMARRFPHLASRPPMPPAPPDEPIRVGLLSGFFRQHSNWKIPIHGWLEDIDPARVAVHGYYTQAIEGPEARRARELCGHFVEGLPTVEAWAERIRADRLHVLLIPEIGMDPTTLQLAALRLAPVQAASWGHPQTSGMPTIDDFLSSDLMEPDDAAAHYTERLVRLPGLSFRPLPSTVVPAPLGRADIGVEPDAVLFWCCQSIFKYLPADDPIFPAIAARVPQARFAFVGYPIGTEVDRRFRSRIRQVFADAGLDGDRHCRFLGSLDPARFAGVTRLADIFLDAFGWSGCNSAIEALEAGLPVVTLPGPMMRGRHSAAILRRAGLEDLIAGTAEAYVDLAVALAQDADRRTRLQPRIAAGLRAVGGDPAPAAGLQAYLRNAAGAAP
ncbi:hypothetical protein STAQ_12770 [Allostella sp. ATCC 35155]|nr:hypothetical protein STAQ_12770 [Stella sp. ATCC 35155]